MPSAPGSSSSRFDRSFFSTALECYLSELQDFQGDSTNSFRTRVLDRLISANLPLSCYTRSVPGIEILFDIRAECLKTETDPSKAFDKIANLKVRKEPDSALAAALLGAELTPKQKLIAAHQLESLIRPTPQNEDATLNDAALPMDMRPSKFTPKDRKKSR